MTNNETKSFSGARKIAIFHQFMDNVGGAEILIFILARELNADIYTTNYDPNMMIRSGFADVIPKMHSIGWVPKQAPFRHELAFVRFFFLNLTDKYDFFIIGGDWAVSAAFNNQPNLWYVHSPLNEIWAFKDYIKNNLLSWWKKPLFEIFVWVHRKLTIYFSKKVGIWMCNSKNTQDRIKKYYNQNALIDFPPIECNKYEYRPHRGYWLAVNRLLDHKRVHLQMKAFAKMPDKKLIIVGSYEKGVNQFEAYKNYVIGLKPNNVEILSWVDDSGLKKLYSECIGFVATAQDEDFGMSVVEAMAAGKPVIAGNEGGYKESVIDGATGILIDDINEDKIVEAVKKIELNPEKYKEVCLAQARKFDTSVFVQKINDQIDNYFSKQISTQ